MNIKPIQISLDISSIKESLVGIYDEVDNVYFFNSNSIDHIGNNKIYKKETFNYFSIYNKNINYAFREIKKLLINVCNNNNINFDKNMYYIESEYFENVDTLFWYDSGGDRPLSFSGYIFLDCEDNSSVIIDNELFNVDSGTMLFFMSSSKIIWNTSVSALGFNIAPMSMLDGQYKQKWIPLA